MRAALGALLLIATAASAEPRPDAACQEQVKQATQALQAARRVRDHYATQVADLLTQIEVLLRERAAAPTPPAPPKVTP